MLKLTLKQYILAGFALASLIAITIFSIFFIQYYSEEGPLPSKKITFIQRGSGLSAISNQLYEEGIIEHPWLFELHLRLRQTANLLRAGEFEIVVNASPQDVFDALTSGPFVQHAITIPEGLTSKEIISLLRDAPLLSKDNLEPVAEGVLLPETYYYTRDEPAVDIVERMKQSMTKTLQRAWHQNKTGHLLKSPEQTLILASIVEKETGKASERPHVAAVFLNRLKKGMILQSDPTVMYGLEYEHNRPHVQLSKADLQIPSSYNTYLNQGLPPTPICNPGKASIEAVMNPADTEDLYFVANGTGGHAFAKTYEEHSRNHQRWRIIRDGKHVD
jgi:UPF0755 protein